MCLHLKGSLLPVLPRKLARKSDFDLKLGRLAHKFGFSVDQLKAWKMGRTALILAFTSVYRSFNYRMEVSRDFLGPGSPMDCLWNAFPN